MKQKIILDPQRYLASKRIAISRIAEKTLIRQVKESRGPVGYDKAWTRWDRKV